jgi:hypothetical protein
MSESLTGYIGRCSAVAVVGQIAAKLENIVGLEFGAMKLIRR